MEDMATGRQKRSDARVRLLDAAELLFAEQGYQGVSLRMVMGLAEVNVSAAHYYFGSKKRLLQAVFERRVAWINAERRKRLGALLDRGREPPTIVQVLEAYVAPALEISAVPGGERFARLAALVSVDPDPEVQEIIDAAYGDTARLFVTAVRRAAPSLRGPDLYWRLQTVYGTMMYLRANNGRVARILGRKPEAGGEHSVKQALRYVIPALAAALSAPALKRP